MRAVSQHAFGGPEVLVPVELPVPAPGAGEVLVRVRAASVNPVDRAIRSGEAPFFGPPPFVLGFDFSGVVTELGPYVTGFAVGDEVYGMPRPPAGGYAEYAVAPAGDLARKPAGLDHPAAAALPVAGLTSYQALVHTARVGPGQRVLVHGAAGGVGHVAVQIARSLGATVLATARAGHHEFLRGLGVAEPIDHTTTDFTTVARDVDVVFDLVGGEYGARSLDTLRPGGTLVTAVTPDPGVDAATAARRGVRFALVYVATSGPDMAALTGLVEQGHVRGVVGAELPLADAAHAHALLERGGTEGKIVLVP